MKIPKGFNKGKDKKLEQLLECADMKQNETKYYEWLCLSSYELAKKKGRVKFKDTLYSRTFFYKDNKSNSKLSINAYEWKDIIADPYHVADVVVSFKKKVVFGATKKRGMPLEVVAYKPGEWEDEFKRLYKELKNEDS